ncbi:TetR/AcrR family transcriptional regulator [Hazenella coriacea]|uniref:TetR family transcriptional regulator n=1 Tax=Hazenella coriacea TaxID=1179467 RepID=A0A4R3LEJ6_9BACL|nr:TetR/AcrR family transcriptional regulator [Hazenella coriacea]TCS95876.1 TetR family transcriptional regulator [Hazenella coriacea]
MQNVKEDPRVIRTRNLVIDAFLALIKEKDFHSISVRDITEHAMINRSTFYNHFPDKYKLLEKIVNQMMLNRGFEKITHVSKLDKDTFRLLVYSFCDLVEELKQTFGRNYSTVVMIMETELKDKLIEVISTFFKSDDSDQNILVATMLVSSIYSASCSWINGNKKVSREAFFQSILPFLMGSISQLTILKKSVV